MCMKLISDLTETMKISHPDISKIVFCSEGLPATNSNMYKKFSKLRFGLKYIKHFKHVIEIT